MSTSGAGYSGYARQLTARSTGWTAAAAGSVSPADYVAFPASGAAGSSLTHFSTGKSGGGATPVLFSDTVTPNIAIGGPGATPRLTPATTIVLA